eukprot:gnl/TRDRNA2_/TRDRNA2_177678_c4_seq42.p1 gnl/TRDRNA2_/TRDRNA2_177678_c4~~gnl/TRDRNA2_/TRDRNA2_177678_c4_seq42.p1  ORF type:complete len:403 (+),score=46.39 gnl/TRDRNA2_/TRDRNA2_177678_c4_seq42:19-1227(+)
MATADEIRAQIAAQQQLKVQAGLATQHARQEKNEALERQRLRKELAELVSDTHEETELRDYLSRQRGLIDRDEPNCYSSLPDESELATEGPSASRLSACQAELDCYSAVVSAELEWKIKGFSWLPDTLKQCFDEAAQSPEIDVGGHFFSLMYHPTKGQMGFHEQRGSLVIHHEEPDTRHRGVTFRYTIWIKSQEQGFVQWGNSGAVCMQEDTNCMIFGPDVRDSSDLPTGIFGMSHAQLVNSEWVIHDVLTAKLKVEVRPIAPPVTALEETYHADEIILPPPTLADKLTALLESGVGCDVTFMVQGEAIRAHGQIISASSDVLQRQLACGMQETISKEIIIDDCEPKIFRAFVRYLYSESFDSLQSFVACKASEQCSSDASSTHSDAPQPSRKLRFFSSCWL